MHRQGTTVVVVEQSVNVALLLAERAVFLEKGQVQFSGPAADLLERTDLLRSIFVAGDRPGSPSVRGERAAVAVPFENGDSKKSPPVIECRGLRKTFGGMTVVDAVDLAVAPGEVVGLIGHNGAGKTTLFDVMCGFLKPTDGSVWMAGEDVTHWAPWERALGGLGRSFQEARLFPSLTVAETIAVACDRHVISHDPMAAAFRMPAATDSEAATWERVGQLVEQLGLQAYANRSTADLSTGTRRIVELACMLAQEPTVILLDEPSGGIAQAETEALGPMLRDLVTASGASMIVIEHDMNLLAGLCDRFVALDLGRLIADGSPSEVLSHPGVIASYLGTDTEVMARSGVR
jgi:ABC-type branched-subunit amino acid transport system ATPase component